MSDTDDEGTFDKEAEREKLRAQLEREEEERRTTQHMSELLLKGATMTNKHCDVCGDPLFRYEGQEFCPTCSQTGEGGNQQPAAEAEGAASADDAGTIDRVDAGATEPRSDAPTGAVGPSNAPTAGTTGAPEPGASRSVPTPGATGDVGQGVANARAALARKLASLAAQAEATEDVGRSRELLAAAREAAEALAAIEDARGRAP